MMMDTELQRLIPLINVTRSSCSISSSTTSSINDLQQNMNMNSIHRYTSLKDIIVNSSQSNNNMNNNTSSIGGGGGGGGETYDLIDPTNIMIRNQLVKHAASAYLQSAAVLVSRNQNWFIRFWEKVKIRLNSYVCVPLTSCFNPIYHYFFGASLIRYP